MAVLMTPPYARFFDNSAPALPLAGGLIYTYAAGTTTPQATYTDYTQNTPNTNPVVLDAYGAASIWIAGSYKFVIKDAAGNTIRTIDNVTSFTAEATGGSDFFESLSGDGSTQSFTVSQDLGTDAKALLIHIDAGDGKGYQIQNPSAYTISGTTLSFVSAPANGTNNIYVYAPFTLLNAATSAAANAATSATNAANSATLAASWATLTTGQVASTDYSSKAYAIGGTGVTGTIGAAKEWATKTSATVDGTLFSAKEYAQGTQSGTGGSAANWAQQTGADVTGAATHSRSAKSWAQEAITGSTLGGSAKDWAQNTSSTVDGTNYSAKENAIGTQTLGLSGGGSAQAWATYMGGTVDNTNYSAKYQAGQAATSATNASTSATNAAASAAAALAAATSLANEWLFASSTTMADPGTGNFRLDNASFGSVTNLAISSLSGDSGNPNLHSFILTWDDSTNSPRGVIRIEKNATNFIMLGVTGNITDNTTWCKVPVSVIASAGSFSASDPIFINFVQYGNNGTLSATGSPSSGQLAKWSGSTSLTNADLTGDVTTSGGLATTLATVNSNVGSFTNASVTVNAKGLVTAASSGATPALVGSANTFTGRQTGNVTALTSSSGHIAMDMSLNNHFSHTATENTQLDNPTNAVAGTSGTFDWTQHASSAKTLAFGTNWKSLDGSTPTVSTTVGSKNLISWYCQDSSTIWFSLSTNGVA